MSKINYILVLLYKLNYLCGIQNIFGIAKAEFTNYRDSSFL